MKQGRSDHSGRQSWKTEPKPKVVDPDSLGSFGLSTQFQKPAMFEGRGYSAPGPTSATPGPGGGRTIHRSGSQGHHK